MDKPTPNDFSKALKFEVKNWDLINKGEMLYVTKKDSRGNEHAWWGRVLQVEKLRNCQRLSILTLGWWINGLPYRYQYDDIQTFNNRSHPGVFKVQFRTVTPEEELKAKKLEELKKKRDQRRAYVQARSMLADARVEKNDNLKLLGLSENFTAEQLKAKKRECLKKWHPDLKSSAIQNGISEDQFDEQSRLITDALSWADTNLQRRLSNNT